MFGKTFQRSGSGQSAQQANLAALPADDGARYEVPGVLPADWLAAPFEHGSAGELLSRLSMLQMEGRGQANGAHYLLPWDDVYAVLAADDRQWSAQDLGLPLLIDREQARTVHSGRLSRPWLNLPSRSYSLTTTEM